MNKPNLTNIVKGIQSFTTKHAPEILTGIGTAGFITTTFLAVKATPKALKLIDEKKKEEQKDKLTPLETVQAAWKPYVPAVFTGVTSTICVIGGCRVSTRRNAALATAYQLSATALNEYKEKVVEVVGEKKEKVVREKVAQKKIDNMQSSNTPVVMTGAGKTLFLEPASMRPFESDIETIKHIVNELNYRLTTGMEEYISLSEFYDEIGLSRTQNSDNVGWNVGRDGLIKIDYPLGKTEDNRPCFVLDYNVAPRYDYRRLM